LQGYGFIRIDIGIKIEFPVSIPGGIVLDAATPSTQSIEHRDMSNPIAIPTIKRDGFFMQQRELRSVTVTALLVKSLTVPRF